ncbi:unnamed protein product [Paramecium sonneborni]|uniref:Uncharacterized protein n=1 Tax=Paramecium sonneborni TaxID=65129 RepID=A0A8S1LI15_9CILI|nr:unnamed protein product [Paramecium sonneborni]
MSQLTETNTNLDMNIRLNFIHSKLKDINQENQNQPQIIHETKTQPSSETEVIKDQGSTTINIEEMQQNLVFSKNESNQIEELSSKLNQYIDQYLQELKESSQFLDQISSQQSESIDEGDVPENLCQKIYQKFISQISLPIIQSCDQISNLDEQSKLCTSLSISTPVDNQDVQILTHQNEPKTSNCDKIHFT